MTGDLNLDAIKWDTPEVGHDYMVDRTKQEIQSRGFVQKVKGPTHFWPGRTPTLIDHSWTNKVERLVKVTNVNRSSSDHNMVVTDVRTKKPPVTIHPTDRRNWKNFNERDFKQKILEIDWTNFNDTEDINVASSILEEELLRILDQAAPIRTVQYRKNYRNDIKPETKLLMKERNELEK